MSDNVQNGGEQNFYISHNGHDFIGFEDEKEAQRFIYEAAHDTSYVTYTAGEGNSLSFTIEKIKEIYDLYITDPHNLFARLRLVEGDHSDTFYDRSVSDTIDHLGLAAFKTCMSTQALADLVMQLKLSVALYYGKSVDEDSVQRAAKMSKMFVDYVKDRITETCRERNLGQLDHNQTMALVDELFKGISQEYRGILEIALKFKVDAGKPMVMITVPNNSGAFFYQSSLDDSASSQTLLYSPSKKIEDAEGFKDFDELSRSQYFSGMTSQQFARVRDEYKKAIDSLRMQQDVGKGEIVSALNPGQMAVKHGLNAIDHIRANYTPETGEELFKQHDFKVLADKYGWGAYSFSYLKDMKQAYEALIEEVRKEVEAPGFVRCEPLFRKIEDGDDLYALARISYHVFIDAYKHSPLAVLKEVKFETVISPLMLINASKVDLARMKWEYNNQFRALVLSEVDLCTQKTAPVKSLSHLAFLGTSLGADVQARQREGSNIDPEFILSYLFRYLVGLGAMAREVNMVRNSYLDVIQGSAAARNESIDHQKAEGGAAAAGGSTPSEADMKHLVRVWIMESPYLVGMHLLHHMREENPHAMMDEIDFDKAFARHFGHLNYNEKQLKLAAKGFQRSIDVSVSIEDESGESLDTIRLDNRPAAEVEDYELSFYSLYYQMQLYRIEKSLKMNAITDTQRWVVNKKVLQKLKKSYDDEMKKRNQAARESSEDYDVDAVLKSLGWVDKAEGGGIGSSKKISKSQRRKMRIKEKKAAEAKRLEEERKEKERLLNEKAALIQKTFRVNRTLLKSTFDHLASLQYLKHQVVFERKDLGNGTEALLGGKIVFDTTFYRKTFREVLGEERQNLENGTGINLFKEGARVFDFLESRRHRTLERIKERRERL